MKRLIKILYSLSVSLFLSFSGLLAGMAHAAGSATMYLTPASGSYAQGSTVSLDVHENSGSTPVYLSRAAITYATSALTFVSFTPGPAWSSSPVHSGGSGSAELDVASGGGSPLTGDNLMGTITFTAVQGGGATANVTLNPPDSGNPNDYSASSVQTYDLTQQKDLEVLTSVVSGSYTLTGGTSGSGGSGSGSGGSSSSSSGSSSSSSKSSTSSSTKSSASTPPTADRSTAPSSSSVTISAVDVSNLSANTATITWHTSAATTSEVDYGLDSQYGLAAAQTDSATSHSVALKSETLSPATLYHFVVKGTDSSGLQAVGQDMTFRTLGGFNLTLSVVDQNNKPVKGAFVSAAGTSATTDSSGKAILKDLPNGQVKAAISYNGGTTNTTLQVGSGQDQAETVKIHVTASKTSWILPIVIIALLVIVFLWARMMMMKRHDNSVEMSRHFPNLPGGGSAASGSGSGASAVITPGAGPTTPTSPPTSPGSTIKPGSNPKE